LVSVSTTSVTGTVVGDKSVVVADNATVGGGLVVSAETVAIGFGDTTVVDDVGIGTDEQVARKIDMMTSTII